MARQRTEHLVHLCDHGSFVEEQSKYRLGMGDAGASNEFWEPVVGENLDQFLRRWNGVPVATPTLALGCIAESWLF